MYVAVTKIVYDNMQILAEDQMVIFTNDDQILDFQWDYMTYYQQNEYYSGKIAFVQVPDNFFLTNAPR